MDDIWTNLRRQWAECGKKELPQRESWAAPQMAEIAKLTCELRNSGWRDACYCPKDGSEFLAWEPSMSTPYVCRYDGEWPAGRWWAMMDGDMWPARPVLFNDFPAEG